MQMTLIFTLFAASLLAQVPVATPPQNPTPAPVVAPHPGLPPGTAAQAAPPAKPVSPDTVVARVNGKPMTAGDVDKLLGDMTVQVQRAIAQSPDRFLQQLLFFEDLEKRAAEEGLEKQDQIRQQLAYSRMMALAQAEIDKMRNAVNVTPEQEQKYYDDNREKMFRKVKAQVILVGFKEAPPAAAANAPKPVPPPMPPTVSSGATRTEAEGKAKADDLRKQILGGADFGKLAKENSDDKASAEKSGDYGEITRSSPYPEPIKQAILNLKPGEVSEPIRQPGGFYLVKAADSSYQTIDQVRYEIHNILVQDEFKKQMDAIQDQFKVSVEDSTYFKTRPVK